MVKNLPTNAGDVRLCVEPAGDSVGIVTPPFSSSSVLKSALGKHLAGGSMGLRLLDSVLHSPCVLGPRIGYESATQEPSLALRCVSAVPTSAHPQFPLLGCVLGAGNQDAARSGMTSESGTLAGAGQECSQVLRMGSKWSGPGGWWGASPFGMAPHERLPEILVVPRALRCGPLGSSRPPRGLGP